uniref:Uncharacterized protein n=1 Tax=Minutocellus polymorphus TaxID=265543 RepID=A0A7S0AQW2_9STRA
MSAKAIATACIETIESANASFTVESRSETITDAEFASVSLLNMFVKRGQLNEGDKEAKKRQDTAATDSSQGLANKRNSSILDLVKKRLSSLNLSEEEYGKSKEKTEFDTDSEDDSDTDSDDDEDEGEGDSVGLEIFGNDSRFAVADDGWVSFSNQAA